MTFALHGEFESHLKDLANLVFVVLQHLVDVAPALIVYSCFLGAEIQAPHQFTDNDKVNSVTDDLGSKWRKMRKFRW